MATTHPALLTGRTATCGCGKSMPSADAATAPFFEYRGPGTTDEVCANCRYHKLAHEYDPRRVSPMPPKITRDHEFVSLVDGFPTDSFYCGDFTVHPAGLD